MIPVGTLSERTPVITLGRIFCTKYHRLHSVALPNTSAIFVLSGEKKVMSDGDTLPVGAGEVFICPASQKFSIENNPDSITQQYIALCLSFETDMIARVLSRQAESGRGNRAGRLSLENLKMDSDDLLQMSLKHLLEMIRHMPDNSHLLQLCMEELLVLIADSISVLPALWEVASTWQARCSGLVALDPARKWTAGDIARALGTSERTLRRHLQGEGASIRNIMRDVRLGSALALLQTNTVTVGEAAYRHGYNSASRFAEVFREQFGVSPRDVLQCNADLRQSLAESR